MNNPDIDNATEALRRLSEDAKAEERARWREDLLPLYRMELCDAACLTPPAGRLTCASRRRESPSTHPVSTAGAPTVP